MKKKLLLTNLTIAFLIYIFGVALFSLYIYTSERNEILRLNYRILNAGACAAGMMFDAKVPGSDNEAATDKINKLQRYAVELGIDKIYLCIRKGDRIFIKNSNTPNNSSELLLYENPPDELNHAFSDRERKKVRLSTENGDVISVFVPLISENGELYVAGADCSTENIEASLNKVFIQTLLFAVILLALVIPLVFVFRKIGHEKDIQLLENKSQLEHAGRLTAMGELTAGIAHEVNQPLCVIRGYLELLKSLLKDDPKLKEKQLDKAFDISINCVEKASTIINHMRSFVRVQTSDAKSTELKEVIDDGLMFFNEQIKLHNINLIRDYSEDTPKVLIDAKRFEQIAVNILSNARYSVDCKGEKDSDFKKEIKISLYSLDGKAVFEVYDNGIGMSSSEIEKCEKPFYTTKKDGEGTGLGLSIVKGILDDFHGEMFIDSKEGEYCRIRIIIPGEGT